MCLPFANVAGARLYNSWFHYANVKVHMIASVFSLKIFDFCPRDSNSNKPFNKLKYINYFDLLEREMRGLSRHLKLGLWWMTIYIHAWQQYVFWYIIYTMVDIWCIPAAISCKDCFSVLTGQMNDEMWNNVKYRLWHVPTKSRLGLSCCVSKSLFILYSK